MRSLVFRALSLLLRFGCPLFIIYVSDSNVLGSYYLFTSFFTFAIFFVALELAIPFSRSYLRVRTDGLRRKVFSTLVLSQGILALILSFPIILFHSFTTSMSLPVTILFYGALVTGACVNEVGRFFWNVGYADIASKRNLLEALIFTVSVIGSVAIAKEVVGSVTLGLLIISNLILLNYELKRWGTGGISLFFSSFKKTRYVLFFKRVFVSVKDSAPQVVHVQILSLVPYVERVLIEKSVGLGLVGSYSFQFSLIQSGASLILMPSISTLRKAIFQGYKAEDIKQIHKKSLNLLFFILVVSLACGVGSYVFIPLLAKIMRKSIETNWIILAGAYLSTVSAVYSNTIAPFYASRSRLFQSNIITLVCLLPMVFMIFYTQKMKDSSIGHVMIVIGAVALLQLLVRLYFHLIGLRSEIKV